MELSRRNFIAAAGAAALSQTLVAKKRIPVALELYSLRAEAGKDLPGTLAAIKKMGYDGIELVCEKGGLVSNEVLWGRPFGEVAKMVKDNGLTVYSVHHGYHLLQGDQIEKTIEINKLVGNRNVTCSWMNASKTIAPWYEHAKAYNAIQARLEKHKMNVGLHNHGAEVQLVEGKVPWDVFMDNTVKGVTGQMHLAAFPAAKLDPVAYIRKYKGRSRTMQLNDWAPEKRGLLLGEGTIDWKSLFAAAESVGGIQAYIIEQESYPPGMTPMEASVRCLENFRKLHG
ncbi:MAG: sugar phosphate isomerase/epimerase [Candidatus Solibacter sp.]|nr:sugar phosphate isomerase/epimerase [Candidatus Solibacter sp.]